MELPSPRVFLAAESLLAGNGGICRVARLVSRILGEAANEFKLQADVVTLSDKEPQAILNLPIRTSKGSRLNFVSRVQRASLNHSHFIYDFLGMARAHCYLPFLRRPFLSFMCGIEVWEGCRPDRIRTARKASLMVSISEYTLRRAQEAFGAFPNAQVCWLSTETDDIPNVVAPKNKPPTVLILGRIDEGRYKGHHDLIRSWAYVVSHVPDARLLIVGHGPGTKSLMQYAAESPVASRIEFRGFVPESSIEAMWAEADVFAMPSRGEGFGLVYIEAMRHSIPVIASVHDAAQEINLEGETGFNINLDTQWELADRIVTLLKNPLEARKLGHQGLRRWSQYFRFTAFRNRFWPILSNFLEACI